MAILLKERFAEQLQDWQIELLATDVSSRAISQAQLGQYTDVESRRGLSDFRLQRHGQRSAQGWQIAESLRQSVRFQRLNLLTSAPSSSPYDLILLRNILIYMTPKARHVVMTRIRSSLAPDGSVLLGSTESASGFNEDT